MNTLQPFRIAVSDAVLADLAARLDRARPPSPRIPDGGESAETLRRIEELVAYWRSGYDWRAQERRLNAAVPHYRATVDGVGLHVIQVPGAGPDPLPLLLTNGWPSSFVEYLDVAHRLADPARYGGDAADAFTVVIPALPGYGFSDRCLDREVSRVSIARLFDRLMVEHLGHDRYVAHGDDIGGGVVNRLGMLHADTVLAVQTTNWITPPEGGPGIAPEPGEDAYRAAGREWDRTEGAYAHVQATRPQILGHALNDSPAGLAAWVLEKWLTWSDPATRDRLSDDDLLTTVMLYWVTETIGSSARLYAVSSPPGPGDVVRTPASVLVTNELRLPVPSESLLRRVYPNLTRYVTLDEGGHFLALESPGRFAAEIRETFRPYRGDRGRCGDGR